MQITAKAGKIDSDGKQLIEVSLQMDDEWSIFGNPIGSEDFEWAQTVLKVSSEKPLTEVRVVYPKGEIIKDKVVGDYMIYKGKIFLHATITRSKDEVGPVDLGVLVQPINFVRGVCTHGQKTLKLKVQ